jgi:hypothetical protein
MPVEKRTIPLEYATPPIIAGAESRAAPPPVLGYYIPQRDKRDHCKSGIISVICATLATLLGMIGSGFEDSKAEIIFTGFSALSILFGFGCAIFGIRQRAAKRAFAVLGLALNGSFVLMAVFLVVLILLRV